MSTWGTASCLIIRLPVTRSRRRRRVSLFLLVRVRSGPGVRSLGSALWRSSSRMPASTGGRRRTPCATNSRLSSGACRTLILQPSRKPVSPCRGLSIVRWATRLTLISRCHLGGKMTRRWARREARGTSRLQPTGCRICLHRISKKTPRSWSACRRNELLRSQESGLTWRWASSSTRSARRAMISTPSERAWLSLCLSKKSQSEKVSLPRPWLARNKYPSNSNTVLISKIWNLRGGPWRNR